MERRRDETRFLSPLTFLYAQMAALLPSFRVGLRRSPKVPCWLCGCVCTASTGKAVLVPSTGRFGAGDQRGCCSPSQKAPKSGCSGADPRRGATQLQEGLPGGSSCPGSLGHAAAKLEKALQNRCKAHDSVLSLHTPHTSISHTPGISQGLDFFPHCTS